MLQPSVGLTLNDARQPARRVGVAVVGLGNRGAHLLRALASNFDAQVRWICDVDSSRLAKHRRDHPYARVTTRLERILDDPGVDAVVLATSVETHYDLAMRVLEAGKHVYVETPLAMAAELADDVAVLGNTRRRIVMCGHASIYSPAVRAVKRMIDAGTLGDVYCISSSRVNLGLDKRAAGVIWDLGPQDFSILLYWLGEVPTSVRAVGPHAAVNGVVDVAFVTLQFASGIVVNVELSWLAPGKQGRTVVVGSERMVIYEDRGPEPVRVFDCGVIDHGPATLGENPARRTGDTASPSSDGFEPLESQLSDFVQAIRAGDLMADQTTLARNVVRIAQAADESLRLEGAEVPVYPSEAGRLRPQAGLAAV